MSLPSIICNEVASRPTAGWLGQPVG